MLDSQEAKRTSPVPSTMGRLDAEPLARAMSGPAVSIILIDSNAFSRECTMGALKAVFEHASIIGCGTVSELVDAHLQAGSIQIALLNAHGKRASDPAIDAALVQLKELLGTVAVVLLADQDSGDRVIEALSRGIRGYIPATASLKVAIEAMRLVEAGGTYIPADSLLTYSVSRTSGTAGIDGHQFTPRQFAVLRCIQQGKANKIIAHELSMSESTVKVHIRNIMQKLKATNRTEVAFRTRSMFRTDD